MNASYVDKVEKGAVLVSVIVSDYVISFQSETGDDDKGRMTIK